MNKNILAIIIDKVSLNQWKSRVKNINDEYHKYFELMNNSDVLVLNRKNYPRCSYYVCSYRNCGCYVLVSYIWDNKIAKCSTCGKYHPMSIPGRNKIPKKYYYSSGLNNRNGYK